jgi:hypothetical protein
MAHFPDLDLIPFLMVRNNMRIPSHWIVGHHPIIIIPLAGIIALITGHFLELGAWYLFSIAVFDVFLHFIHDSIQYQGLHWFSPFLGNVLLLKIFFLKKFVLLHGFGSLLVLAKKERGFKYYDE